MTTEKQATKTARNRESVSKVEIDALSTMTPTCAYKLSILLILSLDEVGQHVLVAPASGSSIRPAVVVVPAAAQVLHVIE